VSRLLFPLQGRLGGRRNRYLFSTGLLPAHQRPSYSERADIPATNRCLGQVTVRYKDKDREKVATDRLDLPPDVANGMILDVLKNIPPDTKEAQLSYVAATPKPRLVKLSVTPQGRKHFRLLGLLTKQLVLG
jgi:hypothetical protein